MGVNKKFVFIFMILLWMSSCTPKAETIPEAKTQSITIQLSTSLTQWLPKLNACAAALDDDAEIVVNVLPYPELKFEEADLTIYAGTKPDRQELVSVLAMDHLSVIVNADIKLPQLSTENLAEIFSGSYSNWNQVPEVLETGQAIDLPIKVFAYGSNIDLAVAYKEMFMGDLSIRKDITYIASWETMINLVSSTPGSIGFLLESHLDSPEAAASRVSIVTLSSQEDLPIIAVYNQPPQGKFRQFLLCLQSPD